MSYLESDEYIEYLKKNCGVRGYDHHEVRKIDAIRIRSSKTLFGPMPYVTSKEIPTEKFRHHPVYNIGSCVWQLDRESVPVECVLGIASSDTYGNVGLQKFRVNGNHFKSIGM